MNRIENAQSYLNNIIERIIDLGKKAAAYIHSYGVAQGCALLLKKEI